MITADSEAWEIWSTDQPIHHCHAFELQGGIYSPQAGINFPLIPHIPKVLTHTWTKGRLETKKSGDDARFWRYSWSSKNLSWCLSHFLKAWQEVTTSCQRNLGERITPSLGWSERHLSSPCNLQRRKRAFSYIVLNTMVVATKIFQIAPATQQRYFWNICFSLLRGS